MSQLKSLQSIAAQSYLMPKRIDVGVTTSTPAIMRQAENGATLDDYRAAQAGIVTRATPARDSGASIRPATPCIRELQRIEAQAKAERIAIQRYERELFDQLMQQED